MITSRCVANLYNKHHKNVIRDIKLLILFGKIDNKDVVKSSYIDKRCRIRFMFVLNDISKEMLDKKYGGFFRLEKCARERDCLDTIEQVLKVKLHRQFAIGKYYIDGYDTKGKVAYEIDEPHHKSRSKQDKQREREIKKLLGCKFIRVKLR